MKSIMSNPKLARAFSDAVNEPIGSTKREQAKSVLSIMKKIGGLKNDGQGGPIDSILGSSYGQTQNTSISSPNYSNLLVFKATPSFKTSTSTNSLSGMSVEDLSKPIPPPSLIKPYTKIETNQTSMPSSIWDKKPSLEEQSSSLINSLNSKPDINRASNRESPFGENLYANEPRKNITVQSGGLSGGGYSTIENPEWTKWNAEVKPGLEKLRAQNIAAGSPYTDPLTFMPKPEVKTPATMVGPTKPVTPTVQTDTSSPAVEGTTGYQVPFSSSGTYNIAAVGVSKVIGKTPDTNLSDISISDLAKGIMANEGYTNGTSTVAINNNNPGNLKYAGQVGATQDARGFAVFPSIEAGTQALMNDLNAKVNSGKYQTINDLMSVYSPDSDNPASSTYGSGSNLDVASALASGVGATAYGMDVANAKYGGNLDQYMLDLNENLKKEYNLPALEQQLSDLKAQKGNFVPTLQTYMAGKDQYLKFIDDMIEKHEESLLTQNMGDPNVAARYNNYLNYLYTLKGRQNTRYGNFLQAAVSDYNADVDKLQTNYNNVYQQYQTAMTQKGTLAQNDYNNLMTRASALYTELQNAPIVEANLSAALVQTYDNALKLAQNGVDGGSTNPKFLADKAAYLKDITIDNGVSDPITGTLDMSKIGPDGLINLYSQIAIQGGDQRAMTEAIRIALVNTLQKSGNDPKKITEVKKLIDDLKNSGYQESETWANALSNSISPSTESSLSGFIETNINDVESAASDLVSGGSGLLWTGLMARKAGVQDKAGWMERHSSLGTEFLNALYDTITINIQPGSAYEKDPSSYLKQIFVGTDKEKADKLAARMAVSS